MTWEPQNDRARTEQSDTFVALSISRARANEGGNYKLILKNVAGSAQASFDVRIQNVPQPVRNLKIDNIQADSAHVTWEVPLDDGGLPITSYFVEYRDMRRSNYVKSERLTSQTFEYDLTRLTKGSKYSVRVLAENKLGLSEPTETAEPFTAKNPFDVPSAPRELKVTGVTRSSCQLQWLPPNNDGGAAIQGYIIERQTETRWIRAIPTLNVGTTAQLVDLIEGDIYDFRVAAVNEEGQGPYSRPSDSVTIKDPYDVPTQPGPIEINELTDTSCVLCWKPPIRDNGSPIIEYIIEQRLKSDPSFTRVETRAPVTECYHKLEDLLTNGEYEFRIAARNQAGLSAYSQTDRSIHIRAPRQGIAPRIEKLLNQTVTGGTQGRIDAVIIGAPEPEVIWYKGGRKLPLTTGRYTSSLAQGLLVLYIKEVQENDAGQYTLEIQNETGSDSKQMQLTVLAAPKIEYDAKYRKQIIVGLNSSIRVPFTFTGSPKPELTVTRADESNENHATLDLFENSGTFLLRQTIRDDTGVYRLQATNECGSITSRFDILVQTVPSPPGGPLQVTASGKDYVSLAWRTCPDDGGSDLIAYVVEKREENKAIWTKVSTTRPTNPTYTCTGLLDQTNYCFRILAENEIGVSEPLELEHAVTAKLPFDLPGPPIGPIKIDAIIQTGCTLSWLPPTEDGGAKITGYVVEGKDVNRQAWIPLETVSGNETTVDVRQLKEDTTYIFRVMSKNIVGFSQPLDSESVTLKRPHTAPHAPVPFFVSDIDIDSCTLEWEIPKFTGGENIQLKNFIIEQRIGDKESTPWKSVAEPDPFVTSAHIGHLKEEKEYYFRIKAVNEIGQSKPTELTRPVIPRQKSSVPSAPIGPISTLMVTRDSITISWGPCKDDGGAELVGYVIEKRDASRNVWQRIGYNDPSAFTYTATGLIENAAYHFRVLTENPVGMSPPLTTVDPIIAKSPYSRPDKPEGPLLTKIVSSTSIECSWQPPLNDGGTTLTGYLIQRRDVSRPIWVKVNYFYKIKILLNFIFITRLDMLMVIYVDVQLKIYQKMDLI
jgi:titin